MANLNGFNASEVEPSGEFGPITPGRYKAIIVESEWKDTASGNGKYLNLEFQIMEGEFHGRSVWANLNLDNPSEKAVQIARGNLSSICRAVGVLTPKDSVELHNLPLEIKIANREYEGSIYNDVKAFYPRAAAEPTPARMEPPKSKAAPWGARR